MRPWHERVADGTGIRLRQTNCFDKSLLKDPREYDIDLVEAPRLPTAAHAMQRRP